MRSIQVIASYTVNFFNFFTLKFKQISVIIFSVDRQSCYMVRADELYNEVTNDASGKGASQGMFIGCSIDTATGFLTFTCEGKDTSCKFKVIYSFL